MPVLVRTTPKVRTLPKLKSAMIAEPKVEQKPLKVATKFVAPPPPPSGPDKTPSIYSKFANYDKATLEKFNKIVGNTNKMNAVDMYNKALKY